MGEAISGGILRGGADLGKALVQRRLQKREDERLAQERADRAAAQQEKESFSERMLDKEIAAGKYAKNSRLGSSASSPMGLYDRYEGALDAIRSQVPEEMIPGAMAEYQRTVNASNLTTGRLARGADRVNRWLSKQGVEGSVDFPSVLTRRRQTTSTQSVGGEKIGTTESSSGPVYPSRLKMKGEAAGQVTSEQLTTARAAMLKLRAQGWSDENINAALKTEGIDLTVEQVLGAR